jgi:uncharacterized protein involved in exopolysaccharide biosynthesis/Mrp family chromosome partitioning ATPase
VFALRDTYTAAAKIVLERKDTQMLEAVAQLESEQRDRSAVETEMDIISSRVFAGRVVQAMNLINHPWFNTYLQPPETDENQTGLLAKIGQKVSTAMELVGFGGWDRGGQLPSKSVQVDRAITSLLSNMSVTRSGESFAVTIRVSTPDPELSATIANAAANMYVEWSRELKREAMSNSVDFLRERADQVASRIAENEREITDFSRLNELASDERDDLVRKRMGELNTQLTAARGELATIRARREQARSVMVDAGEIEGVALDSPLLTTLRGERALLLRERAQNASNFAAGHPLIVQAEAQLGSVEHMIRAEMRRIIDDLAGEEKVVENRVQQLEDQISELQTKVQKRSLAEIRLRELERDLLADQKLHDIVVARLGNLDPFEEIARPSARVVSVAEVPTAPSFPKRGPILAGGAAGSLVLAIIFAVMLEATDTRITSAESIAQVAQLRNLASIPRRRRRWFRGRNSHGAIADRRDATTEAFRSLYLASRAQLAGAKGVIIVTSPLPRDGVTTVAFDLARAAARDGVKALYIASDPCSLAYAATACSPESSLPSFLARREVETASSLPVEPDDVEPALHVLRCDRESASSIVNRRVSSDDLRTLFARLRLSYDFVVIDAAPVLIVEDANWLASIADMILLVVRFWRTSERELVGAVSRLSMGEARPIGTVLNFVDARGRGTQEPLGAISYPRLARPYFES